MTTTPTPPLALPALPEPYSAASTLKCVACGAPYEPARALAPQAAQAFYPGRMSSSVCKCGSNAFQGTVGYDSPSPAQFTADQMNAHATAAILSDRAGRGDAAGCADSLADWLDLMADDAPSGSQQQSDLRAAAAAVWRKQLRAGK